jgi:murein lipoprotein
VRSVFKPMGTLKIAAGLVVGSLGLSACATRGYVDEQIAMVNTRISSVEASAMRRADAGDAAAQAANAAAQAANAAAQAAATDARTANQRLDQLTPRVDTMEQQAVRRRPRN